MFDKMAEMFGGPQSQETLFRFMAQQVAQAPPEMREAMARVEVIIVRKPGGINLVVAKADDDRAANVISNSLNTWSGFLSSAFQALGCRVKLYE